MEGREKDKDKDKEEGERKEGRMGEEVRERKKGWEGREKGVERERRGRERVGDREGACVGGLRIDGANLPHFSAVSSRLSGSCLG